MTLLTVDDLRPKLREIVARMPKACNPTVDGTCLYTDPVDSDRHCLAGQLAAELGWQVPGPDVEGLVSMGVHIQFGWPLDEDAVEYLTTVQGAADMAIAWDAPGVTRAIG